MDFNLETQSPMLQTMVGGQSVLDSPRLHLTDKDEAYAFVKSYGFDLHDESDVQKLWGYHRRALVFLTEKLLDPGEEVPAQISDPKKMQDIRELLLLASSDKIEDQKLRRWACALLRVMHIFVHSEKDLFSYYSAEIQKQVLSPIEECVVHEADRILLKYPFSTDEIRLVNFAIKPFKTASSSAIKLLAKPDVVALKVLDKVGVRFVTETLFDSFQVALFLAKNNLLNFAHVMPDQSTNTLFPLEPLLEIIQKAKAKGISEKDFPSYVENEMTLFLKNAENQEQNINFVKKINSFSSSEYRFLKFICRKLISITPEGSKEAIRFFYPFEVQIVDQSSFLKNESGSASHNEYKTRQRLAARQRVFPDLKGDAQ